MISKTLSNTARLLLAVPLALVILLFFGEFVTPIVQATVALLAGWIQFLRRVLPAITLNPAGIAMFAVCSGLIVFTTQRFCAWMYGAFRTRRPVDSPWPAVWPWRWSLGIYCGLWLLFLTAMSVTGVAHQVGWLWRSETPVIAARQRGYGRWHLETPATRLLEYGQKNGWSTGDFRWLTGDGSNFFPGRGAGTVPERWHVVLVEKEPGKVAAAFLTFRDPELSRKHGYFRVTPAGLSEGPIERMAEDIRSFGSPATPPGQPVPLR